MFDRLAGLADRRARPITIITVVVFLIAAAVGGRVAQHLDPYGAEDPATESIQAKETLQGAGYQPVSVVVTIEDAPVKTAAGQRKVATIAKRVRDVHGVESVIGHRQTRDPDFVSHDGRSTFLAVTVTSADDKERQEVAVEIADQLAGEPGVLVGGFAVAEAQVNEQVESDLQRAELMAFPILLLLSLLFFRSLVAALLPLMVGAISIVGTFFLLRMISEVGSISVFALNLTTGLGLGLAIDYSLFIVSRYREEIAVSGPGLPAMRRTMATAGRTVLFSSLTVAAALASLLIFPQRYLYSMGAGGVIVALLSATVALTVLPAVLTLLGNRVNSLAPPFLRRRAERDTRPDEAGFWYRLSRFVMRRPVPVATISATFLILLGLPFLGIKFTGVDPQVLPASASAHQVDDLLRSEFPPHRNVPVDVVLSGTDPAAVKAAIPGVVKDLRGLPEVKAVAPPRTVSRGVVLIEAHAYASYLSEENKEAVRAVRALPQPGGGVLAEAGGGTAQLIDFQASIWDHLPEALAIVIVSTLIVLFLMTGSVVLPFKALLMNFLNLSAVFGIIVLIFQDGRLEGLLNYTSQGAIEQGMPILVFATAFGLSTDYAVFLLSRIKEARDEGASESECVAIGLERTGRIVTAAALLFAIAMGAFATSEIVFVKENGIGIALAVLIDASIVRALLVPSLMELLGRWNWWAPRPLRRFHDRYGISEFGNQEGVGR